MATKNIVPNSDGEGKLGTSSKSWAEGHIDSITGTITTAAQGNITSLGTLTTLTVDDITINGSTISDAGDLLFDVGGDISLDAAGGDFIFLVGGSQYGKINFLGTNNLTISGSAADHAGLSFATHSILPAEVSATTDGTIDLGASSEQFKTIFLSTGVVVANDGTIGSAGTTDAIKIASDGDTSLGTTQVLSKLNVKNDGSGSITRGLGLYNNAHTASGTGISLDFYVNAGDNDRCARVISQQESSGNFANLEFHTSNNGTVTKRLTIGADGNTTFAGNVGIGDSAFNYYANSLVVKAADEGGVTFLSSATNAKFYLAFADGTTNHNEELAGMITFDHNNNEMALGGNAGVEHLKIANGGDVTVTDGDLIIGTAGHGIDFGAAKAFDAGDSSTVLDDYEEGLYTPSFTPQTNGSITLSGALNEFSYTKVGRLVTIVGKAEVTSVSSPQGIVRLSIPIAIGSLSGKAADFAGSILVAEAANNAVTTFAMFGSEGNSYVEIYEGDTTSLSSNVGQEFQANTLVWVSMTYVAA